MTFLVAERMAFSYHPLKKAQFKHQCPFSYKSYLAFKKHIFNDNWKRPYYNLNTAKANDKVLFSKYK